MLRFILAALIAVTAFAVPVSAQTNELCVFVARSGYIVHPNSPYLDEIEDYIVDDNGRCRLSGEAFVIENIRLVEALKTASPEAMKRYRQLAAKVSNRNAKSTAAKQPPKSERDKTPTTCAEAREEIYRLYDVSDACEQNRNCPTSTVVRANDRIRDIEVIRDRLCIG